MVDIFMMQHEEGNISNYQSTIVRVESFDDYLKKELEERSLPNRATFIEKHIDEERKTVMTKFLWHLPKKDMVVVHFAQQING